jgi:hypothetical protein
MIIWNLKFWLWRTEVAIEQPLNRVPTLSNQLLPHLLADILQTLHSCYGHIEDVHVTFWKYSDIFRKFPCSWTWSFFQHVLNRRHLLCEINSSHTFRPTFIKPCTVVMDTLKMCMWLFGCIRTFFEKFPCSWT